MAGTAYGMCEWILRRRVAMMISLLCEIIFRKHATKLVAHAHNSREIERPESRMLRLPSSVIRSPLFSRVLNRQFCATNELQKVHRSHRKDSLMLKGFEREAMNLCSPLIDLALRGKAVIKSTRFFTRHLQRQAGYFNYSVAVLDGGPHLL